MSQPGSAKWARMASAPKDGSLVLARVRATEQGPAEVDAVRWAVSARSGEGGWVANDSDPFARVVYAEVELSGWMPLPTQVPGLRRAEAASAAQAGLSSKRIAAGEPPAASDESDGSAI